MNSDVKKVDPGAGTETRAGRAVSCALLASMLLAVVLIMSTPAAASNQSAPAASYLQHPSARAFIDEAIAEGHFKRAEIEALLASASRQDSILEAIARPAEKTKTWAEYRPIFMTQDRIDGGVEFYKTYKAALTKAEQEYGVSRFIIMAIIGVETRYGKFKGNYRVIDALATLTFDYPPRAPFFRSELKNYFYLKDEAHIDLMNARGSYAGAMGFPQFISSSYRKFAVDFDADNHIDLINNPVDAIGSVASYFKAHGWVNDEPVISLARFLGNDTDEARLDSRVNQDLKPVYTIADFGRWGLVPDQAFSGTQPAIALRLDGSEGMEYWLALNNFYVISRYNHSPLYSLAVYQLSEALRKKLTPP